MFNSINQWMWDADQDLPFPKEYLVPVKSWWDWRHFGEMVMWVCLLLTAWAMIIAVGVIAS